MPEKKVLGGELRACSYSPLTGYFRDGCCATHGGRRRPPGVRARHRRVLEFSVAKWQTISSRRVPTCAFRGLKHNDRWCLHVLRWVEAWEAGRAPRVVLEATHEAVLSYVPLSAAQASTRWI